MNLITGGAGFIGSHLVSLLVRAGEPVRVMDLPGRPIDHLPLDQIEFFPGDIRNRAAVRGAVRGCRRVYHLAANPNLWLKDRSEFLDINHRGTINVLEESLDAKVKRILHTSTESILTSPGFNGGAVEDLELDRRNMVGPYCLSKYLAEEEAFRLARGGAPVVIVNPTLPIGPGDLGKSPPTRMTVACARGSLPAYLDFRFNVIDARDIALGMQSAMDIGIPGRRYLLGFANLNLVDWLLLVSREVGRHPPRVRVPYWLALGISRVSEFLADHVTGNSPLATVTGVRLAGYCMHFDPSKSLQELGLNPRPVETSIRDAVAWYRRLGWI